MKASAIPLILGSGINALGLVRSFHGQGICVYCLDNVKDVAAFCRYVHFIKAPQGADDEELNRMIESTAFGKHRFFIIPTTDFFVNYLINNYSVLENNHVIGFRNPGLVRKFLNKHLLYQVSAACDIPTPATCVVENLKDFIPDTCGVGFPMMLKPTVNFGFKQVVGQKVLIIKNIQEYNHYRDLLLASELAGETYIVQQYIEGPVSGLYTCTSYSDENGKLLAASVGHKIRQAPAANGTIVSGRVTPCPAVLEQTRRFYLSTGFSGFANIEYKFCPLDGKYYIMEINPRPGVWNYSATFAGVNIAMTGLKHARGEDVVPQEHNCEVVWGLFLMDFAEAVLKGNNNPKLNIVKWLRSVNGRKVSGIFWWKNPRLFLIFVLKKLLG